MSAHIKLNKQENYIELRPNLLYPHMDAHTHYLYLNNKEISIFCNIWWAFTVFPLSHICCRINPQRKIKGYSVSFAVAHK